MTESSAAWRILTFTSDRKTAEAVIAVVEAYISSVYQPQMCDCWLISHN